MLSQLYKQYQDRAAFFLVYLQEAHPTDLWQMQSNVRDHVLFANPKTDAERAAVAESCVRKLHIPIPALIDPVSNQVEQAYTGWPDRLYLVGKDGQVRFKSAPGPFGFEPKALRNALEAELKSSPST